MASAQVGKPVSAAAKLFGEPIKDYSFKAHPTKIYLKDGLQIQLSYKDGIVDGAVYSVAAITSGGRQPITPSKLREIYKWNGFAEDELVPLRFKDFPALNGIYKKTKDSKLLVVNDKTKNLITISDFSSYMKYLQSLK